MKGLFLSLFLLLGFSACQQQVEWPTQTYELSQRQTLANSFVKEVKAAYAIRKDGALHGPYNIKNGVEFSFDITDTTSTASKEIIHIVFTTLNESGKVSTVYKIAAFMPKKGDDVKLTELAQEISNKIANKAVKK